MISYLNGNPTNYTRECLNDTEDVTVHVYVWCFFQDLQANVKKIAEFLQVDVSKDLVANIVDKCHIEKMRNASRKLTQRRTSK